MLKMKIPKMPKMPKMPKIPTKILTAMGSYSDACARRRGAQTAAAHGQQQEGYEIDKSVSNFS